MAKSSEFKKISFTSSPDQSGNFDIANVEKDIRSIVNNAVKSSLPENTYFKVSEKQLLPNGQTRIDVYVHEDSASLTEASMRQQAGTMTFKGSSIPKYDVSSPSDVDRKTDKALIEDEKVRNKEETETVRFNKGALLKIMGILTTIAEIARRILSSVLAYATQTTKDMITAHNLSMSYDSVRRYRHIEQAHGLKEDTITGGITDVQTKFGNITELDEESMNKLAVVMGSEVKEMVRVATSEQNPEKAMAMIIDAFNAKANAGYNSYGQYVGEANARRELYSYLLKLSPQWADIFATMQEEQHNINSIFRNQADTFENWKNAFPSSRGGHNKIEYNVTATLGQEWNLLKSILDQIKQALAVSLAPAVLRLVRWLTNRRIGLSASENAILNAENRIANQAYIKTIDKAIYDLDRKENTEGLTSGEKGYKMALKKEKEKVQKELNKKPDKNVDNLVRTLDEVRSDAITDTYSIIALGGLGGDKNEDYMEAIRRAVKDNLDPSVVENERNRMSKSKEKELRNKKLAEKVALYNSLRKQYLAQGMTYGEVNEKIANEHPELLGIETVKKKTRWGKEYEEKQLVLNYKSLTPDEVKEINDKVSSDVTEDEALLAIANSKKYGGKLKLGSYIMEIAREQAINNPEASLTALYQEDMENPNAWFDRLQKEKTKWLKKYGGYGAKVIGVNEKGTNGEVIHKIVLDINNNGKIDKEDYVLGSFLGMEGYSGDIGELRVVYDDNGKAYAYVNSQGTTASQMTKGD